MNEMELQIMFKQTTHEKVERDDKTYVASCLLQGCMKPRPYTMRLPPWIHTQSPSCETRLKILTKIEGDLVWAQARGSLRVGNQMGMGET